MSNPNNTSTILGNKELTKRYFEGTLTSFYSDEVKKVLQYGLADFPNLKSITLPNLICFQSYAFANNPSLESIIINENSYIQSSYNFDNGYGVFQNCKSLNANTINNLFRLLIKSVDANGITTRDTIAGYYMFSKCYSAAQQVISIPKYSRFTSGMIFSSNSQQIKDIELGDEDLTTFPPNCGVKTLFLPNCVNISILISSTRLTYVVLASKEMEINNTEQVCALSKANAFSPSKFLSINNYSGGGGIFVPDELVADYKNATNWSLISDYIYPLSNYTGLDNNEIIESWESIISSINNNDYEKYLFKKKVLYSKEFGYCYMVCVAIDADTLLNGETVSTTWLSEDTIMEVAMQAGQEISGYSDSNVRNTMNDIFDSLDGTLKNAIKPVRKYTRVRAEEVVSEELVWIPSLYEFGSGNINGRETNGVSYQEFFSNGIGTEYRPLNSSNSNNYMLARSLPNIDAGYASAYRGYYNMSLTSEWGCVIGFCI